MAIVDSITLRLLTWTLRSRYVRCLMRAPALSDKVLQLNRDDWKISKDNKFASRVVQAHAVVPESGSPAIQHEPCPSCSNLEQRVFPNYQISIGGLRDSSRSCGLCRLLADVVDTRLPGRLPENLVQVRKDGSRVIIEQNGQQMNALSITQYPCESKWCRCKSPRY